MKFHGRTYWQGDKWVVFIDNEDFRFQEFCKNKANTSKMLLAKIFGKRLFKLMVNAMVNVDGENLEFELTDKRLTYADLNKHCDGKWHKTGYDVILWEAKQ